MPQRKKSHNQMYEGARDADIKTVFQALTLHASEEMKPEVYGGTGAVPEWYIGVLRCWVNYERGVMQYSQPQATESDGDDNGGGDGVKELAEVLRLVKGGGE